MPEDLIIWVPSGVHATSEIMEETTSLVNQKSYSGVKFVLKMAFQIITVSNFAIQKWLNGSPWWASSQILFGFRIIFDC